MKKISILAFTAAGARLGRELEDMLATNETCVELSATPRAARAEGVAEVESARVWTAEHFATDDALVFIGAAGIAVRSIAPWVCDKFSDPAVVCVDERGLYAIPLLSGHVGGANSLARRIAKFFDGQAVIGTATDINRVFSVDEWAKDQELALLERGVAKEISARLLDGSPVGFCVDERCVVEGALPRGLVLCDESGASDVIMGGELESACVGTSVLPVGIYVGFNCDVNPFPQTLHLVPRCIGVGVGCRRGASVDALERAVCEALARAKYPLHAVMDIRSVDLKADEECIRELAERHEWRTRFLSAEQLASVSGTFEHSDFVEKTVGVDNVCGRAACWPEAELLIDKRRGEDVTAAVALHRRTLEF